MAQTFASAPFSAPEHSPSLPAFEHDLDDYSSPVQSPMSSAYDVFSDGDTASVYAERAQDFPDAQVIPRLSQYSSLKTWAGDGEVKNAPLRHNAYPEPFVVTVQTPSVYDPEGIMQDAFDAASYAHLGGWDLGISSTQASRWSESGTYDYPRGQDVGCRQGDNDQLFNYVPLPVY